MPPFFNQQAFPIFNQPRKVVPATIGMPKTQASAQISSYQQMLNNLFGMNLKVDGVFGPQTFGAADKAKTTVVNSNPAISSRIAPALQSGQTVSQALSNIQRGDISKTNSVTGQPFSNADQRAALRKAQKDLAPYYKELRQKETQDVESALKQRQRDYQEYLASSGEKFQEEKTDQDQTAADSGVLFSGGRYQKLQNLQKGYERDQSYQRDRMAADIGNTARDYQYKYGNKAAGGLSSYYNLGGNTYNPNVATGGVGSGGMSSVYNTRGSDFIGSRSREQQRAAEERAAGFLTNTGNKLLSTSSNNRF